VSRKRPLIFSTASYDYLRERMEATGGFERGELERTIFPDGEHYQRVISTVRGRHVVIVGGTITNDDTMDIFDLACGLVKQHAEELTLVVPFYGYSTMERPVKPGEIVTAKTRALQFSAIPQAKHGNNVFMLDLHAEGIPGYFEGNITTRHIYAKEVITKVAKRIAGGGDFVLASTDAGRAKWVESLAKDLGVLPAFAYKSRVDGSTVESRGVNGAVAGKLVILYDDMIRTGGSLIEAGKAYKAAGAKDIAVIATHGLFPNNGLDKLKGSGLFTQIVTTDSHPNAVKLAGDFLSIESVAGILARELKKK